MNTRHRLTCTLVIPILPYGKRYLEATIKLLELQGALNSCTRFVFGLRMFYHFGPYSTKISTNKQIMTSSIPEFHTTEIQINVHFLRNQYTMYGEMVLMLKEKNEDTKQLNAITVFFDLIFLQCVFAFSGSYWFSSSSTNTKSNLFVFIPFIPQSIL